MRKVSTFLLYAATAALFQIATASSAYAIPFLGAGWNFSVLGATTVTNTGATTLDANVGVSVPPNAVTGSGTITFTGGPGNNSIVVPSLALAGQGAATTAVGLMNALGSGTNVGTALTGLDGLTLTATGVNTVFTVNAAPFTLTAGGVLTLDFAGVGGRNIILKTPGSTLIADTGSSVKVINAVSTDNVFWEVGSSATLNAGTSFVGYIIASASVSMLQGAQIGCGGVVAQTGQVSMINNTISELCSINTTIGPSLGTVTPTPTPGVIPITVSVPEPGTLLLLGFGIACVMAGRPRSARGLQRDLAPNA